MKKYVVCSLNDENYTEPWFDFCNTLEEAKEQSIKNVMEVGYFDTREEALEIMDDFEEVRNCDTKEILAYRYDAHWNNYEETFFVNYIIEVDDSKGDYFVAWHHAYNGVDFEILHIGTESECIAFMQDDAKKCFDEYGCEEDIDEDTFTSESEICFDTGDEWEHWTVEKFNFEEEKPLGIPYERLYEIINLLLDNMYEVDEREIMLEQLQEIGITGEELSQLGFIVFPSEPKGE